jgi:uncharacterized protein
VNCGRLELLDWRRRVADLYAAVRERYRRDPADAHELWRVGRDEMLGNHPCSPLPAGRRSSFSGLPVAPYDPAVAFAAPVDPDVEAARFEVTTSTGRAMTYERVGVVDLPVGRLELLWLDEYAGGVFLPFRDATAGRTTYGGGRYLLDTPKSADLGGTADGQLVLDFNFAYHPSCHYDPAWSCPLAPPGNRLEVAIEAGELAARS